MAEGKTIDGVIVDALPSLDDGRALLKELLAAQIPAEKRASVVEEDLLRYLAKAAVQYEKQERPRDNERIIITQLLNNWLPDTNQFDPQKADAVFTRPADTVYVLVLPVAREWHREAAKLDLRDTTLLSAQTSPFFIATKGYLGQKDFGFLFN